MRFPIRNILASGKICENKNNENLIVKKRRKEIKMKKGQILKKQKTNYKKY